MEANGTHVTLIGVVYGERSKAGDFPEVCVVELPDLRGPPLYPDHPTWELVLPITCCKGVTEFTRRQLPLVAGFAFTLNKAQGLTIKEGVVAHLVGGERFLPASKHGLPFVAWTRSERIDMIAFKD